MLKALDIISVKDRVYQNPKVLMGHLDHKLN